MDIELLRDLLAVKPITVREKRSVMRFLRESAAFRQRGGVISHRYPILSDYLAPAGTSKGHYFHQDLLVATYVFQSAPLRHVDVGSRIDGFVAHVASFRKIEVIDIRALPATEHPNIEFVKLDMMDPSSSLLEADSVSCLHALEHFGLGRYGDPIDPQGHIKGFTRLVDLVSSGGTLYLSFPVAGQTEVHFNAHRVFHPEEVFSWPGSNRLTLQSLDLVDDSGALLRNVTPESVPSQLSYGCAIYRFRKS